MEKSICIVYCHRCGSKVPLEEKVEIYNGPLRVDWNDELTPAPNYYCKECARKEKE